MKLLSEEVDYPSPAGRCSAYLSRPASTADPRPGVVVIQEVWGVGAHIRDVADRFANAGYAALAPDLYSAGGARPPALTVDRVESAKAFLDTIPPADWMAVLGDEARRRDALSRLPADQARQVGETIGALFGGAAGDSGRHVTVLRAALSYLRSHPACAGRSVGSVGYCMGGGLSALLACEEPGLSAAVIYYGPSPSAEQVAKVRCPVRGFYGQDDPRVIAGLPAFAAALESAGIDHALRIYAGAPHAFFNDTRPSYRPEAARDAWARTLAFFAEALGPVPTVPLAQASSAG